MRKKPPKRQVWSCPLLAEEIILDNASEVRLKQALHHRINSIAFHIFSSHFKVIFESKWHHGYTSWRMAETKCTGTGVTDCRAALINKWLALPGAKQLGIDPPKKWSFSVSNIALIKAVYTCLEKVHSRGLSRRRKVVGVLFLCLLLLPLLCTFQSETGRMADRELLAAAKGSTTALIPVMASLSVCTHLEKRPAQSTAEVQKSCMRLQALPGGIYVYFRVLFVIRKI